MTQIDVRSVLSRVVPNHLTDLVTRSTGRAVRSSIEAELSRLTGRSVIVLDFSAVRVIDCSCADEIVVKLVQASLASESGADPFFLVRGLSDHQIDEIEEVLLRQRLALVALTEQGLPRLLGEVAEQGRVAFERVASRGDTGPEELAEDLAWPLEDARTVLDELVVRRLLVCEDHRYRPLTAA